MGTVQAVNISDRKGEKKHEVSEIWLREDFGVENDAHGGSERQVSLLALECIEDMKKALASLKAGDFAENITTTGIIASRLTPGMRVAVGDALIEITQIGKTCHNGCAIRREVGSCIMPKEGIFGRVLQSGCVRKGDGIEVLGLFR
ncbi:MOSC domain-containing protein [Pseudodesulfovibrio piezophilus]|uniref:MOSC domain containing protein n=1 Tax=Pseudodesulfovibrio piezophilus (strain DSM 21447 / JCM 15486 / C1TLV30) TaxID=1322246 RepID=M1WWQ8_PSEP2|nr:MOSC domain-containing protein [Pseudodesulfovibrio piezophilus]CCH49268.1 MOSC domain containing protein [Pseudodesulfovibrio piezophilus C1TLV30]